MAFLKDNPLSTSEEIFKATGSGVLGMKYVRPKKYHGKTVWRLNHPKMRRDGLL